MNNLLQDIRYALRILAQKPGFTAVAVITLALGIGANTAIFSVVNAVLLKPLPYAEAERLVWIWETSPSNNIKEEPASAPNFNDWRTQNQVFEDMIAFARTQSILTDGGEPERIAGTVVTANFFPIMRADAMLGRTFLEEEHQQGKNQVVILSNGLWHRRFGSDPNVIGAKITLNGRPYEVVGVMPATFKNPRPADTRPAEFWLPYILNLDPNGRRADFLAVIARLKPGLEIEQARAEMSAISSRLEQEYPATNDGWSTLVVPLHERFVGDVRPALLVLLGAVSFLLLIGCANVANLLLARATGRQREIAIRMALGAARKRLIQQLLTESLVLSLAGAAVGLLLALWGISVLIALSPGNIPRMAEVGLNGQALGFTLGVSLVIGVLFGLVPALQASNPNLNESLKEGGRSNMEGARGNRIRSLLAVSEIALALVLLIGAGLMVRSFLRLQEVSPGFNPDRVLTMELSLPASKYPENLQVTNFYNQLIERVESLPGVESAAAVDTLPLSGGGSVLAFSIEGRPPATADQLDDAETQEVTEGYFRTMNIPLLRGRVFNQQDTPETPLATVVSETFVRRFFPDEDPLGKRISLNGRDWLTVVGIVGDVKRSSLDSAPYPQLYRTHTQTPRRFLVLVARTASDPMSLVSAVRSQVRAIDPDQPLSNIRSMEQVLSDSIARPRFNTLLISIFAVVALVLTAIGLYGVISYSVTQRTHEIGVRMALGAQPSDITKMVVGQGLKLALVGVGLGLAAAFALTRVMASLLFGATATDPLTYIVISVILASVALLASYIPARRATKVDPMIALRYE